MNRLSFAVVALVLLSGMPVIAQDAPVFSSASQVTLKTLAPSIDVSALSGVQIRRIEGEVGSDTGLSRSDLLTILGDQRI